MLVIVARAKQPRQLAQAAAHRRTSETYLAPAEAII
jgi:hypothetical protein